MTNFPLEINGRVNVFSGSADIEVDERYGGADKFALLVRPHAHEVWIALFVDPKRNDVFELRYSLRERFDERIRFRRQEQ